MDPLSITASIGAIAHVVHVSLRGIRAVRRARLELAALYNEVSDLRHVLLELEAILDQQAQSSSPAPPNARFIQKLSIFKIKMEQLSTEVASWNRKQPLLSLTADHKHFSLLRIATKALKFRDQLREIKINLSTHLSALSS